MIEFVIYKICIIILKLSKFIIPALFVLIVFTIFPIIFSNVVITALATILITFCILYWVMYRGRVKDKMGDFITQKILSSYCLKSEYSYLHYVMIKSANLNVVKSHIDHIIITRKGIAVIKTKFHEGKVYGTELEKDWTYITSRNDDHRRYYYQNPITQNNEHIEALKRVVGKDVQYYNILLYVDSVDFTKCEATSNFTKIGYGSDLEHILDKFDSLSGKDISIEEAVEIYNRIQDANILNKDSMERETDSTKQNNE